MKRFESALREYESRAVERTVPGVEYKPIRTSSDDEGMLAVHIPESPYVPHRSLKDRDFYLRAGGTFSALPLTLIEDLLIRRIRPQMTIHFEAPSNRSSQITVSLRNMGIVAAKWPYIVIEVPSGIELQTAAIFGNSDSWVAISEYQGKRSNFLAFCDGAKLIVHQYSEVPLINFYISSYLERDLRNLRFPTFLQQRT